MSPKVRQVHKEKVGSSEPQGNNIELMEMLKAMRQEMQERDNQLKVQLQLRDEYMDAELKIRYQNPEEALRLRDEEWKSRWEIRKQELSEELKAREDAFLSDQLRRDSELLKIMKKREDAMEKNLLHKADAFRYLYKEHQKEIRLLIEKRDKELEGTVEDINGQHLYRILVPSDHILLSFCIRISAFDRSRVFVLVQVL